MVKPNPHSWVGGNRQQRRQRTDSRPLSVWLLGSAVVWSLVAGIAGILTRDLAMWFLVWFAGILVFVELVPPDRLQPRSRRAIQLVLAVGYLGFVVASYSIVQPWISS